MSQNIIESRVRYVGTKGSTRVQFILTGAANRTTLLIGPDEFNRLVEYGDDAIIVQNSAIESVQSDIMRLNTGEVINLLNEKVIVSDVPYRLWFLESFASQISRLNEQGIFLHIKETSDE